MNVKAKIVLGISSLMIIMFFIIGIPAQSLYVSNSTGTVKIDLSSTGNINATGTVAEGGVLLSNIYLKLAGGTVTGLISSNSNISTTAFFIGNGSFLTSVSATVPTNGVNIAGENITSGTIAFARLPTLTNTLTLAYQNISGVPTCTAGQYVLMNSTGWICSSPPTYNATYATYIPSTNVAFVNNTNIFTVNQNMSTNNITTVNCVLFKSGGKICDSA
jgi:hypothetical protein